jgi:hypothetical protein
VTAEQRLVLRQAFDLESILWNRFGRNLWIISNLVKLRFEIIWL